MPGRQILLYEINEVPWLLIDRFMKRYEGTQLAEMLRSAQTFTTLCDDPNPLEPWRSWATFHTGLSSPEHRSLDLGQDPQTFGGEPVWDSAAQQGLKVGVFGALQSWPARTYASGGFYVPDTFARSPECVPAELTAVQALNLRLTRENLFSADAPLSKAALAAAPVAFLRAGMRLSTAARLGWHLLLETMDARHKAGRSMMQADPMFDIFMNQVRKQDPHLSIFFTNLVAGMMHRFWADAMESFGEPAPYTPDPIHAGLIWRAMLTFDRHLRRLKQWVDGAENRVLIVGSSMGQAPIPYRPVPKNLVLRESSRLLAATGCPPAEAGLAMYPSYSLKFGSEAEAEAARKRLYSLVIDGEPLFQHFRQTASTLHLDIVSPDHTPLGPVRDGAGSTFTLEDLGILARERLGGANTAHHVPQGTLFLLGAGITPDPSRREIDARSVRARMLDLLGCSSAPRSAAFRSTPAASVAKERAEERHEA